ncbi:hypothetical protein ACJJTC_001716 [Scirpophaga incertulas]
MCFAFVNAELHIFKSSEDIRASAQEQSTTQERRVIVRARTEKRAASASRTHKWMLALLVYNTCVAPMSSYCADNIFQYGIDLAKYNVISHLDATYIKKKRNYFFYK